ncbi:MAG: hypothetical protein ACR2M5_06630 [Nakamurella sp.]
MSDRMDPLTTRRTSPVVSWLLALLGVAAIVVAIIYFVSAAGSLPGFFPGHQAGSAHHHTTHGVAALVLGLLALLGAWMSAGRRDTSSSEQVV